jgi:hypothetical protein
MNKEETIIIILSILLIINGVITIFFNNNKELILKETSAQYIEAHCYYAGQVSCEEIGQEDDFNVQCLYGKKWLCYTPSGIQKSYSIVSVEKEYLENYLKSLHY